jgi:Protein of unknown function (DUF1579)
MKSIAHQVGKQVGAIVGASVFVALAAMSVDARAQTPSAGPPPPPAAAMPAPKPATPPPPAAAPAKPVAAPAAAAKPAAVKPAAASAAAAAPPPPAPKPAAELDQLKYFEGTWKCAGKQPAGPFGPEHDYKSSFKMKKDVDDFWIGLEYAQKKSKVHPMPIKAKGFVGWDSVAKKFVTIGVDNTGGWITESSTGWEGDKLVFSGDGSMMGQKVSFRETYAKKSDKAFLWTGEMKMGKDFISVGTDDCKK